MPLFLCVCAITGLIVTACANVGCFQCLLFGLPDRTLLREREGDRPLNNVLSMSFSEQCELCLGQRDSCLIQTPRGTAGEGGGLCVCVLVCLGVWALRHIHNIKHEFMYKLYVARLPGHDSLILFVCRCTCKKLY